MKPILPTFSHVNLQNRKEKDDKWARPLPLEAVLKSEPANANTYDDLVKAVAQILHRNRSLTLFYRGQSTDHKSDAKTMLLPSIFRKKYGEDKLKLSERFSTLNKKAE